MNPKRMLWIMLAVVIGFTLFNFFSIWQGRQNYEQVSYRAVYSFDWDGYTSMDNLAVFSYENLQELEETRTQFNEISSEEKLKNYIEVLQRLSEGMVEPVQAITYSSTAYRKDQYLEIVEEAKVRGLTTRTGQSWITGFGGNELVLQEDSQLVFIFPDDARILSVEPQPTSVEGMVLTWSEPGKLTFPVVRYERVE